MRIGKFNYASAFGKKSPTEDMTLDATFIMASCTKLMASIAALQCVEKGLIGLDDDLSEVLPEFKEIEILTGFEKGESAGEKKEKGDVEVGLFKQENGEGEKAVLKKATGKITLRYVM